ncbi:hypothetical protein OEZ85_011522 [Tetradesmus obliquus]|uniref:SET domain-containing protein n=1 Tax=Tetradesmus obliquus TaxID=3088 RepID=A0ABY8TRB0_TETOB|nr:hypothetical protein OEZ85_011522 [Tetradesmus obliquus]
MDTGSLARPLKLAAIGAKVKKQFHSETEVGLAWFNGTVTKYDPRRQLYWITYEDDDQEEMAWAELKKHLQQLPSGNAVAHDSADQQRQAKQQVAAAKASGGTAAAAPSSKSAVNPIDELTFEPARVLARAHFAALAAFLQRVQAEAAAGPAAAAAAAAAAGAAAGEVVLAKGNGKQQVPLWAVQDEAVKVHKGDVLKALQANAVDFERGKEPWRRFAAAAAAVAGSSGSSSTNGSATADAAAAAAAAAALAGCVLFVADQPFADADAALANAVKAARGEFQRENRLAYVTEAERVRQRRAEREAHLAAAANNAAVNGQHEAHLAAAANNAADNNQQEAGTAAAAAIQKNPSARPDRVAESLILQSGRAVNRWGKHKDIRDTFGHLPGIPINHTFGLRSEALVLGAHKSPMAGIACAKLPPLEVGGVVYRKVPAATSIVMSGCYEDDHDAASDIVKYTGEGGNDLLGNKKQVKDQVLERGNRALLANIALGLPVRLFRRNDDRGSATSSVLFYDGLYDVVSWVKTRGKEGKVVYIYGLRRRAGQAASLSKPIERFKGVGTAKRAGDHVQNREHLICTDVSKGREATPIVAVNEVNRELPPGLSLEEDAKWIVECKKATDGPLLPSSQGSFRYITENEYEEGVDPPRPPVVVEEGSAEAVAAMAAELAAEAVEAATAAEAAGDGTAAAQGAAAAAEAAAQVQAAAAAVDGAAAAAAGADSMEAEDATQQQQDEQQQHGGSRQLRERSAAAAPSAGAIAAGAVSIDPSGTGGRPVGCQCWFTKDIVVKKPGEAPHELLKRLNYGHLPYESRVQAGSDKGPQLPMSRDICPVIFECGDWTGCSDPACDQRQAQRGVHYKLELFMTAGKGWGMRSWQAIKAGSLVCVMHGRITRAEAVGDEGSGYESSSYFFDMTPRTWRSLLTEGVEPVPQLARRCAQEQRCNREWSARYVLCAKEQGGVARFINHSCEPNLYVQPLCVGHTDTDMVAIGLFALENIPKFTELSYDYGSSYIEENLGGVCLCGTDACKYKPQQTPQEQQEQVQEQVEQQQQ